jgi:hypothetical protein
VYYIIEALADKELPDGTYHVFTEAEIAKYQGGPACTGLEAVDAAGRRIAYSSYVPGIPESVGEDLEDVIDYITANPDVIAEHMTAMSNAICPDPMPEPVEPESPPEQGGSGVLDISGAVLLVLGVFVAMFVAQYPMVFALVYPAGVGVALAGKPRKRCPHVPKHAYAWHRLNAKQPKICRGGRWYTPRKTLTSKAGKTAEECEPLSSKVRMAWVQWRERTGLHRIGFWARHTWRHHKLGIERTFVGAGVAGLMVASGAGVLSLAGLLVGGFPAVAYSQSAPRTWSDMDGAGTAIAAGDTVTTNAYRNTADISPVGTLGTFTVSAGGELVVNAGITATFGTIEGNFLANRFFYNGTSGSTISLSLTSYVRPGGYWYSTYTTFAANRFGSGGWLYFTTHDAYVSDCTLSNSAANAGVVYSIGYNLTIENSTIAPPSGGSPFSYLGSGELTLIDVAMTGSATTGAFVSTFFYATVNICGNTTFNSAAFVHTNIGTNNWFKATTNSLVVGTYAKITTTVTGGVTPAVSVSKAGTSLYSDTIYTYKSDGRTTAGVNVTYALCAETLWNGSTSNFNYIVTYYSDQNQAETGNNSQYHVGATSASGNWYDGGGSNVWAIPTSGTYATGVAVAITLTAASTAPTVGTVTVSDGSITKEETVTVSAPISGTLSTTKNPIVTVHGKTFEMADDNDDDTWTASIQGDSVGVCSAETVTVIAYGTSLTGYGASATTLTITQTSSTMVDSFLNAQIDVENPSGKDSYGADTYGTSNQLDAYVTTETERQTDTDGNVTILDVTSILVSPDATIEPGARITLADNSVVYARKVKTIVNQSDEKVVKKVRCY